MINIFFAGQDSFGNRGCEALIRSNVKTIQSVMPDAKFLVPSRNQVLDGRQWVGASQVGVRFVNTESLPPVLRWWGRARRLIKPLAGFPPSLTLSEATRGVISESDVLVMTGGDNISLDYGLESLYFWSGMCETALRMNKPVVLWAGSVGPFSKIPSAERHMRRVLAKFQLITVRETASFNYLRGLGLNNIEQVTDPAFALDVEAAPDDVVSRFDHGSPVLGFNVSPLILKFRDSDAVRDAFEAELVAFLDDVVSKFGLKVLLIPHVDPLDESSDNSDWVYMSRILDVLRENGYGDEKIGILPRTLNAAQLKDVIRRCAFFMGARTHATIAALSQGVPTTSIAYSVKAKGINEDLFGHTRYVLDTPEVSRSSLHEHLALLKAEEVEVRSLLAERLPLWKSRAHRSAELLHRLMLERSE